MAAEAASVTVAEKIVDRAQQSETHGREEDERSHSGQPACVPRAAGAGNRAPRLDDQRRQRHDDPRGGHDLASAPVLSHRDRCRERRTEKHPEQPPGEEPDECLSREPHQDRAGCAELRRGHSARTTSVP